MRKTAILLALGVALTACSGKEQRLAEHLEKGRSFFDLGQYEKAKVELKNVLQIDPKQVEAYYLLGRMEEGNRDPMRAYAYYAKAIDLDPEHIESHVRVGTIYLFSGDVDRAAGTVETILAMRPDDPGGLTLKAAVMSRRNDAEGATALARQVVAASPDHVEAVSLLAGLERAQGRPKEALKVLEAGVAAAPAAMQLRLALVTMHVQAGNFRLAENTYRDMIALEPDEIEYRVGLARLFTEQDMLDEAEAVLREAVEVAPDDEQRYLVLVDFLAARRGWEQAQKALLEAIDAHPRWYKTRFDLAARHRARGETGASDRIYESIVEADRVGPAGLRARMELADTRFSQGRSRDAASLVADVLKENPRDNRALILRGRMSMARGDALSAIPDFRTVVRDQPDSIQAVTLLAQAHLANEEPQLAKETVSRTLARFGDSMQLRILLAEIEAAVGNLAAAGEQLDQILKDNPRSGPALTARAGLEMRRGDAAAAERALAALGEAFPDDPQVMYRTGAFYLSTNRLDKAARFFSAALEQAPQAIEPLTGMVNVHMARKQPQRAIKQVEEVIDASPDNFLAWALLGNVRSSQGMQAEAEAAFRHAVSLDPKVAGSHVELARHLVVQGDNDAAVAALQAGLQALTDDASLSFQLAELYRRMDRIDDSIAQYERMLAADPDNELAANNLASLLLDARTDQETFERALELSRRFEGSGNPAYLDSLGWAYYRTGNYQQAVSVLRRASARAPESVLVAFHLGMALHKAGETAQAKPLLQRAVDANLPLSDLDEARQILAAG